MVEVFVIVAIVKSSPLCDFLNHVGHSSFFCLWLAAKVGVVESVRIARDRACPMLRSRAVVFALRIVVSRHPRFVASLDSVAIKE